MSSKGGSFSSFGLYVGTDSWVNCHHYGDKTPILVIDAGDSSVSISPAGREASDTAVEFARALVRNAQAFAAEIERLHAAQHPNAGNANADSNGADGDIKAAESKAA
jgi:hypothetical protein